mmetsp:Transcript_97433/g.313936  ORF Transcript_97433/g.313936 Transcript_97433/m.313936 type:complete len:250 (+) Transcript_97433:1044-1793(+)
MSAARVTVRGRLGDTRPPSATQDVRLPRSRRRGGGGSTPTLSPKRPESSASGGAAGECSEGVGASPIDASRKAWDGCCDSAWLSFTGLTTIQHHVSPPKGPFGVRRGLPFSSSSLTRLCCHTPASSSSLTPKASAPPAAGSRGRSKAVEDEDDDAMAPIAHGSQHLLPLARASANSCLMKVATLGSTISTPHATGLKHRQRAAEPSARRGRDRGASQSLGAAGPGGPTDADPATTCPTFAAKVRLSGLK